MFNKTAEFIAQCSTPRTRKSLSVPVQLADRLKDYVHADGYKMIHECVSWLGILVEFSSCRGCRCAVWLELCLAEVPWPGGAAPSVLLPPRVGGVARPSVTVGEPRCEGPPDPWWCGMSGNVEGG